MINILKKKFSDSHMLYKVEWSDHSISYEPLQSMDNLLLSLVEAWEMKNYQNYLLSNKEISSPQATFLESAQYSKIKQGQKKEQYLTKRRKNQQKEQIVKENNQISENQNNLQKNFSKQVVHFNQIPRSINTSIKHDEQERQNLFNLNSIITDGIIKEQNGMNLTNKEQTQIGGQGLQNKEKLHTGTLKKLPKRMVQREVIDDPYNPKTSKSMTIQNLIESVLQDGKTLQSPLSKKIAKLRNDRLKINSKRRNVPNKKKANNIHQNTEKCSDQTKDMNQNQNIKASTFKK